MMYELVETINGLPVVTAEYPATSLAEARQVAGEMMPTHLPAWVREQHAEESGTGD